MALFKGELSLQEILWGYPYKRLNELITERQDRLIEEEKAFEKNSAEAERQNIRNSILSP